MRIVVGSKNPVKIKAVEEIIQEYGFLKGAEVCSRDIESGVSEQPSSLEETISGARFRAEKAFTKEDIYGFGIESGIMEVPYTKTGFMNISACSIYDGKEHSSPGISSAFQMPLKVQSLIEQGMNASEAFKEAGLTKEEYVGYTEGGIIGILTNNRITRVEYAKEAIRMALISLEFLDLYK